MKGDFTRWSFSREKHYHSVLKQQGRVDLDADWNEQDAIASHRVETETVDVVGASGAPVGDAGFMLSVSGNNLNISKGRAYVDGLLCENEQDVLITSQPELPGFKLPTASGTYVAYLKVWLRHLTALDDAGMREDALGGPDTCSRAKTVWQVNLLNVGASGANITCSTALSAWDSLIAASTGTLAARAEPSMTSADPCIIPAAAGYRRLENQLYRVEIHDASSASPAFKWSRDNGSVAVGWKAQSGNDLTISSAGPVGAPQFAPGQWIELIDDTAELNFLPGTLVQLANVQGTTLSINPATATGPVAFGSFPLNPKIRRWDSAGPIGLTTGTWFDIEDGVQVQFKAGTFSTGDYWIIPARTLKANIDWPTDGSGNPVFAPPKGIVRHYCKLAVLGFNGTAWSIGATCLPTFPPLTQITAGQDKAIHVTKVQLAPDLPLPNDSDVLIASVFGANQPLSLVITCDAPIDPVSVGPATCIVEVEVPYPLIDTVIGQGGGGFFILGFERLILPGITKVSQSTISWQVAAREIIRVLYDVLSAMVARIGNSRLRVHLVLKGSTIWGLSDPSMFLDGNAFGTTRRDPDGSTHIGLRLPSGDGKRGGDFEFWFWLYMPVSPSSLSFDPNPVNAGANSTASISLNGPAPAGGAVVTLSGQARDPSGAVLSGVTAANIPTSVTVPAGQTSAQFSVTSTSVPSNRQSVILEVTANYAGSSVVGDLTINRPLGVIGIPFAPPSVLGNNQTQVTGTVSLSGPAPAAGAAVGLTSNNPALTARLPASVTVPAGQSAASFAFAPGALPVNSPPAVVQVTGTYSGTSAAGSFSVTAIRLG
jgi:Family of unknown function (DUF6519)